MLSRRVFSPSLYFCVKKHPPVGSPIQRRSHAWCLANGVAGFRPVTPHLRYWRENYCALPFPEQSLGFTAGAAALPRSNSGWRALFVKGTGYSLSSSPVFLQRPGSGFEVLTCDPPLPPQPSSRQSSKDSEKT
jgi:hypothetical protein